MFQPLALKISEVLADNDNYRSSYLQILLMNLLQPPKSNHPTLEFLPVSTIHSSGAISILLAFSQIFLVLHVSIS
jgi:hypothetical protein